jgi:hypothetical protein
VVGRLADAGREDQTVLLPSLAGVFPFVSLTRLLLLENCDKGWVEGDGPGLPADIDRPGPSISP